jgi:hypothetical protein
MSILFYDAIMKKFLRSARRRINGIIVVKKVRGITDIRGKLLSNSKKITITENHQPYFFFLKIIRLGMMKNNPSMIIMKPTSSLGTK